MLEALVRDHMATNVTSIDRSLDIDVALEIMRSNSIRRLPVVSKTDRVIGIITLADAMVAKETVVSEHGRSSPLPTVNDVMTDYVYTVEPDSTLVGAAKLMIAHKVGALPVVEDSKLVGLITESDIFRFVISEAERQEAADGEG